MKNRLSKFSLRKNKADSSRFSPTGNGFSNGRVLSEENYRDLVERYGSVIMKADKDLNITYMNDFGLKFFGYSMEELIGRNVVGTTIQKRDDYHLGPETMVAGNEVHQNIRKNGELVWVSWTHIPKLDKDGNLAEILSIGNDISKLIDAEKAIKDTENSYKLLYENLRDAFVQMDMDGNILECNEVYREMLGYTAEELRKLTYKDITPPKWHEIEERILNEQLKSRGYSDVYEKEYIRKDGTVFPVELRTILATCPQSRLTGMWAIIRDISWRKRTEQALLESEKKFRDMFESAPIDMAVIGFDGTIIDINNAAVEMHGFSSREELLGKNCLELVDQAYQQVVIDGFRKALEDGHITDVELVQLRKDGQKINTIASATVLYDTQSKPYAYIAMVKDITERKRLENELKKYNETLEERVLQRTEDFLVERKRLFDVLETIPAMVCLLSEDYRLEFTNRSFRNKFGESPGEHCYEYCQNKKEPCEFCETNKVLMTGNAHRWESSLPDKTIIDIYDYPFEDADGSRLILKMYIDITKQRSDEADLKSYRDHLEKLNRELLRSNQELENFAYVATHDLQEPLRMITSFTQLLELKYKEKFDDTAKEYMGFIVDGGKRMYELINGLLAYSGVSRKGINISVVDLNKTIDIVKVNLSNIIKARSCRIECRKLPVIEADQNMMVLLFQNLISNGIKFSKEAPRIYISCKSEKKHYVFSVKDEGIGIDPLYYEKIFQIFKRLMPKEEYEGTGIGLAICKKIVENHNGKLWVKSEPEKGSVFYFTLPIKKV